MKEIPLTQGQAAKIDDEDHSLIGRFKWYLNNRGYAARNDGKKPNRKTLLMHREILHAPLDISIDHVNGDRLDNRLENLRPATRSENAANQRVKPHSSIYKGVRSMRGKWEARIKQNQKLIAIGTFNTELEAARAYDAAAVQHFGEYARLNLP